MPTVFPPLGCYYEIYPESDGSIDGTTDDIFDPDVDWKEDLDVESPGDVFLTTDGAQHAILHGIIPYNKVRSFCLYALGYAAAANAADGDGLWRMYRINPPTHPMFPFLRVRSVSIRGFEPRREVDAEPSAFSPPPPVKPWFPYPSGDFPPGGQDLNPVTTLETWETIQNQPAETLPARVYSLRSRQGGEDFGGGVAPTDDRAFLAFCNKTTRYEKAKITVEFHQPNWPIKEDDDPNFDKTDESDRNVFWTTEPVLDVLAIEGGEGNSLFWREGVTLSPPPPPGVPTTLPNIATNIPVSGYPFAVTPSTSGFKSPLGYLEPKLMDTANWMAVPQRFFMDDNLIPTRILECLGRVNSVPWFGYDAGTALFIGATFQPVAWPIHAVDHYVVNLWNIKLHFKYYNPDRRDDSLLTPDPMGAGRRGFRLFRYQDGFSYWATRWNGDDLYKSVDFARLFQHREQP